MYSRYRLVPKSMTLNDLWARFKVTNSLNAAKMAKYSLVMTRTPCRVAGCISIRPMYSVPVHLLTCTVGSGRIKPAISLKRLKIEWKLLLTAYIKSYTSFRLGRWDQNVWPWIWPFSEIQGHLFFKCRNVAKWRNTVYWWLQRYVEWLEALSLLGLNIHASVHLYLLTYTNNQCFGDWLWSSFLTFQRIICLPFRCFW